MLRAWITAGLWLVVYMEVATPPFIIEYDLRPNRLFVEYLIYPKEVFGMLWSGYKLELFIGLVVSVLTVVLGGDGVKLWFPICVTRNGIGVQSLPCLWLQSVS
ncbi:phosphoglycerol transferase [Vibrio mimicus]|nr:phosphoglycerol transferase [Vibrio mimicus]